jgi:hypothetical protein
MGNITVNCPSCGWKPDGKAHWKCNCGTQFNAFDTLGKCPTCSKQYEYTQCVEDAGGCNHFTTHDQWYNGLDEAVQELIQELQLKTKPSVI